MRKILALLGAILSLALFTPKALAVNDCCRYTIRYNLGTCYAATLNNGSITDGAEHDYNEGDWAEFTLLHCDSNCSGMTVGYVTGWHWSQPNNRWVIESGPYPLVIQHTQFDVKFHLHGWCSGLEYCAPLVSGDAFGPLPCYKDNCGQ